MRVPSKSQNTALSSIVTSVRMPARQLAPLLLLHSIAPTGCDNHSASAHRPCASAHGQPTIDVQTLSGNEAGHVGRQQRDPSGDVIGTGKAAKRRHGNDSFTNILGGGCAGCGSGRQTCGNALTVMPKPPSSWARERVMPIKPPLAVIYEW